MKPIHKFNSGRGATLCHRCHAIIELGFTDKLYCNDGCKWKHNPTIWTRSKEDNTNIKKQI